MPGAGRGGGGPRGCLLRLDASLLLQGLLLFSWGSLLLCYALATSLGHVPVFLPMISDCFVSAPEKWVSRLAVVTFGGVGMGASVVLLHLYLLNYSVREEGWVGQLVRGVNLFSFALGILGSCGLAGVGAVPENDDPGSLHVALATTFFVCFAFQMLAVTAMLELQDAYAGPHSRAAKLVLLVLEWGALYGISLVYDGPRTQVAVLEWTAALTVFLWMYSISFEISAAEMTLELMGPSATLPPGKTGKPGRAAALRSVEVPLLPAGF